MKKATGALAVIGIVSPLVRSSLSLLVDHAGPEKSWTDLISDIGSS